MKKLVLLLVLVAWPATASARDLFAEANADYAAQRYDLAIAKYEELLKGGLRHEVLHYNLANAYFRSAQQGQEGKLGRAILNYERALAIDPDFEDARYNLDVARELSAARHGKETLAGTGKDPFWMRVANWMPLRTLLWIVLAIDIAFFVILIVVWFLSSGFLRTSLIVTSVFVGFALLVSGALLTFSGVYRATVDVGVIVADEAPLLEGPDPGRRELVELHAGHRVVLVRENHGWVRVRLANRMEGWVRQEMVDTI